MAVGIDCDATGCRDSKELWGEESLNQILLIHSFVIVIRPLICLYLCRYEYVCVVCCDEEGVVGRGVYVYKEGVPDKLG